MLLAKVVVAPDQQNIRPFQGVSVPVFSALFLSYLLAFSALFPILFVGWPAPPGVLAPADRQCQCYSVVASFLGFEPAPFRGECFGESGLLKNEPTAPAKQAHTTQRQ